MNNHPYAQSGFSLLEIVMVLAISASLLALATPSYRDLTRKTQAQLAEITKLNALAAQKLDK